MSQHDQNIANDTGAAVRSDLNNALGALFTLSSGASAPSTTIAYMVWADTTSGLLKQRNASNTNWLVRGTLAEAFVVSRSSNTILAAADFAKAFVATSGFTQTLTAAATLADGWFVYYRVNSGATVTIDPNGAETIDGAATKDIVGPAAGVIFCNGSAFFTYGVDNPAASDSLAGIIELAIQSEMEAGTDVLRAVVPGRQHFHPSAAKAWVKWDSSGGVAASYNIASVTDNSTGNFTVNIANDFSSANYAATATGGDTGGSLSPLISSMAAGSLNILFRNAAGTPTDCDPMCATFFGDQ